MLNQNAGIDNALKMGHLFAHASHHRTKILIDKGTKAVEVDDERTGYHITYLFNDDGTYKGYPKLYLR